MQRDSDRIPRNVMGTPLRTCSELPLTGFYRDGCCSTGADDLGAHIVCAEVNAEFLAFSQSSGNDLTTPNPAAGFAGLRPGDRWCLCATRWVEALQNGAAPRIFLAATHEAMLDYVSLQELNKYAIDPC